MKDERQSLHDRFQLLRAVVARNVHSQARALLRDLHKYPEQERIEHLTREVVDYCKSLDRGLQDEHKILSTRRRGEYSE